ncbi:MAG: hypothetical protein O7G85_12050, partial [Planctomycetota bacterium]|nr:hypothetical protein [Planctomycetota bacterium]
MASKVDLDFRFEIPGAIGFAGPLQGDLGDGATEFIIGICIDVDPSVLAFLNIGDVALGNLGLHDHAREVRDGHDPRAHIADHAQHGLANFSIPDRNDAIHRGTDDGV